MSRSISFTVVTISFFVTVCTVFVGLQISKLPTADATLRPINGIYSACYGTSYCFMTPSANMSVSIQSSFVNAQQWCVGQSAWLAIIDSQTVQNYTEQFISSIDLNTPTVITQFYIGGLAGGADAGSGSGWYDINSTSTSSSRKNWISIFLRPLCDFNNTGTSNNLN